MAPIRILVADDHEVVREGTRRMLEREADIDVVARPQTVLHPEIARRVGERLARQSG